MFSSGILAVRSGAVKRFVITTSVNQVSKANIKFEAAQRLENKTGKSKFQICFSKGDTDLSMTRNCRVHCIIYV